jgi:hypothetical protein
MSKKISNTLLPSYDEVDTSCQAGEEMGKIIEFPNKYMPVRLAKQTDIKDILELWGNSATMKFFVDPIRWNWKGKASEVWADYANHVINDENRFLVVCDLKDNGFSGFLLAKIEELPVYYQAQYAVTVEELYLRPKDKKVELLKEMLEVLIKEAYSRRKLARSNNGISLKIETIESDESIITLLRDCGFKKSSVAYTAFV